MGVAVKVTEVPWQMGLAEAEIETLTTTGGLTVIVIVLLVAGLFVTQLVREEVRTQLTTSLFKGG
jgi:hypothetical protein